MNGINHVFFRNKLSYKALAYVINVFEVLTG